MRTKAGHGKRGCLAFVFLLGSVTSATAWANINPSAFEMNIHRVAISVSGDCSNPIVIYSPPQASYVDLVSGPTLGESHLDDGTYPCVMFEISPVVMYSPESTEDSCVEGTEYTASLCAEGVVSSSDGGDDEGGASSRPVQLLDGTAADCATSDWVVLYLSPWSSGATSTAKPFNPFQPPASSGDGDHGVILFNPLVVSGGGSEVGTFTVEFGGNLSSNGQSCEMSPPKFGFVSSMVGSADGGVEAPQK